MALKAYIMFPGSFSVTKQNGPTSPVEARISTAPVPVFENGVLVTDGSGDNGVNASGSATVVSTDTVAGLKTKLQNDVAATFNSETGRTDGNTIQFYWVDDKGIL